MKALKLSMAVLTDVTASGRRGRFGGGHAKLPLRRTQYAVTSPAKIIVSKAMKITSPSCALLIGGWRSAGAGGPLPPVPRTTVKRRSTLRAG